MRACLIPALVLLAMTAHAETAYVSDELVLGVYSEKNQQGTRLATLHSGASVEVLARENDFAQIRMANDAIGWVKGSFLTTQEPAANRIKTLEAELAGIKSTTPAMAEAAARSELQTLQQQLEAKQSELETLKSAAPPATPRDAKRGNSIALLVLAVLLGATAGFVLGYATLARRIRQKFGGIKVY